MPNKCPFIQKVNEGVNRGMFRPELVLSIRKSLFKLFAKAVLVGVQNIVIIQVTTYLAA